MNGGKERGKDGRETVNSGSLKKEKESEKIWWEWMGAETGEGRTEEREKRMEESENEVKKKC